MKSLLRKLDGFEARIQALVERSAATLFRTEIHPTTGSQPLLHPTQEKLRVFMVENDLAPSRYYLTFSPADLPEGEARLTLIEQIRQILYEAATESGYTFGDAPEIILRSSPDLDTGRFEISFDAPMTNLDETNKLTLDHTETQHPPVDGYLILPDNTVVRLLSPATNLGRGPGNDVRIEQPQVSRRHAQIREVGGGFRIFDLDSRSGTFINGSRVSNATLTEGDVISCGGVPLIFGRERTDSLSSTNPVELDWDNHRGV